VKIGILAFGSLLHDTGPEIAAIEVGRIAEIETPFAVEFARSSTGARAGAPTLVPVSTGGARVRATVIVLKAGTDLSTAKDLLYRRETRKYDPNVRYRPDPSKKNQVFVETLHNVAALDIVLYTMIRPNITELTAEHLADLAIESARELRRDDTGMEGIVYLQNAIENGIHTPLTDEFQAAILRKTGADSLAAAREIVRREAA
jgi:hypothetical protein